ncbi:MAG: alpha/beta fold hydrolase [Thermaurantimonas sp.]|uniref:alpha/beta fold hydrolase n=1 Tax=Thermaurantimonas sp. TaxID=2681568 RepID=UPI0039190945
MKNHSQAKPVPSFKVPKWIPITIRMLEKFSPNLALKLALKIFFRPIPFNTPPVERKWQHKALQKTLYVGNMPFTVYRWGKKGPKVLLVHGWSGRGTQFYKLIKKLLKQGYQAFAVDAPGHGRYPAKKTDLLKFIQAVETVHSEYGPFYALVGHSLGGVAISNAIMRGVPAQKLVVIGSPALISNTVKDFCVRIGVSKKIEDALMKKLKEIYGDNIQQYSLAEVVTKLSIPGLIVHDTDDEDVNYSEAQIVHQNWPGSRLLTTSGLGHRKVLRDKHVNKKIIRFLEKDIHLRSMTNEQIQQLFIKNKKKFDNQ